MGKTIDLILGIFPSMSCLTAKAFLHQPVAGYRRDPATYRLTFRTVTANLSSLPRFQLFYDTIHEDSLEFCIAHGL